MQVKEVMSKEVSALSPDTNALEALQIIMQKHISGLPVLDKNNKICGMLTETEILKSILPGYIDKVGKMMYIGYDKAAKKMQNLKNLTVNDIMRTEVLTVQPETSLAEIARLMLMQKRRRIPIVKENKVVGIIAREDVVRTIAKDAGVLLNEK